MQSASSPRLWRPAILGVVCMGLAALSGCATVQPQPEPVAYVRPPNTTVYAYPMHGQSPAQQRRDRYQCTVWAVHQTGFDPSAPGVPIYDRVAVQAPPPGTDTAIGAVAGALLGAAISNPWNRGAGVMFGAVTGAMIGNAADQTNAQMSAENAGAVQAEARAQQRALDHGAREFRRAVSACLQARGYSVR
jgi:uncharacterized membrane protein